MIAKPCCGSCEFITDDNIKYICGFEKRNGIPILKLIDWCPGYKPLNPIQSKHEKMWEYLKCVLEDFTTGKIDKQIIVDIMNILEEQDE